MAGIIQMTLQLQATNAPASHKVILPNSWKLTQTGQGYYAAILDIGTTEEPVTVYGDVGTPAIIEVRNLDPVGGNFVELGVATTVYGERLLPSGMPSIKQVHPTNGCSLYLKADTANCLVEVVAYKI